jgi:molybdopterin synthase sulfur carrier subunit
MKVKVRYFASIREKLNKSEEEFEIENNITLKDFIQRLSKNQEVKEVLFESEELKRNVLVAINAVTVNKADLDKIILKDNDVVAFFPVISAG